MSKHSLPTPGSAEAVSMGCKCPVLDNAHGTGYMGGVLDGEGKAVYVINEDCPLHGLKTDEVGYGC